MNTAWMLWQGAARWPEHPAVETADETVAYAALRERAAAIAGALGGAGVQPGDRVAMLLERGPDAVAALFGAAAFGAVAVPLHDGLAPRQIEHVLNDSDARLLVTHQLMLARLPRQLSTSARVLDVTRIARGGDFRPVASSALEPALILYTSGSSGKPKGVVLSHANLWAAMQAVTGYLGIVPEDRIASLLPLAFVYGLSQVLCAVGTGAALVVETTSLVPELATRLRAREISVLAAVPPLWLQLIASPEFHQRPLKSLRVITSAGGHLPVDAVRSLRRAQPHARLFLMYGLTEAMRSTYLSPDEVDRRPTSIGQPMPGTEVLVLRDDYVPCGPDEIGELVHAGPTVAMGYWNDPEATSQTFRPHPLRPLSGERVVFTGDLGRRDAEGFLYFVGRRDRLIKCNGYRVSPEEVVDALYASGEVADAEVTSEPDERGHIIRAHVVLSPGGSLERLRAFCGRELPRWMRPERYDVRQSLPRLSSGKHDLAGLT